MMSWTGDLKRLGKAKKLWKSLHFLISRIFNWKCTLAFIISYKCSILRELCFILLDVPLMAPPINLTGDYFPNQHLISRAIKGLLIAKSWYWIWCPIRFQEGGWSASSTKNIRLRAFFKKIFLGNGCLSGASHSCKYLATIQVSQG